MKVLAIDSSGITASVAVVDDDAVLGEYTISYKKTHSQTLLPMIDALTGMIELDAESIDAIAVSEGPGSFTGLRIGSATAKGIGLAWKKPLVEVPTVDALAENLCGSSGLVVPIMDARRAQVYTGIYRFDGMQLIVVREQCALKIDELLEILDGMGETVTFLGDGVPVHAAYIRDHAKFPIRFAPQNANRQRAASVGVLGLQYLAEGRIVTAAEHSPEYLRKSQAEREQEAKGREIDQIERESEKLKPTNHPQNDGK